MVKYDVITFGSAVVDVYVDAGLKEKGSNIIVPEGDKILIKDLRFSIGGGGTNTAVSFSKFGLKTGFGGKIGDGKNAEIVLRELKKEGVDFLGVQGKEHTGYSVILGSDKERTIFTHKGINNLLSFHELKPRLDKVKVGWFYMSSMIEQSFRTQEKLVEYAKSKRDEIKVVYNPSSYQVKKGKTHLKHILKNVDVLIFNKEEAEMLVSSGKKTVGRVLCEKVRMLGPKIVCITDGKNGGFVSDGIYIYEFEAHKRIPCVERTGAGDAFASGFVCGLIKNKELEECIQIGVANSESVIQKPGAKGGLLTWSGATKIINEKPVRIFRKMVQ